MKRKQRNCPHFKPQNTPETQENQENQENQEKNQTSPKPHSALVSTRCLIHSSGWARMICSCYLRLNCYYFADSTGTIRAFRYLFQGFYSSIGPLPSSGPKFSTSCFRIAGIQSICGRVAAGISGYAVARLR